MNKSVVCCLSAIIAMSALAMTPGGIPKKHVGLLFDVMRTSPSNILANADQFAEHAPYLDGVAISLNEVPVVGADGTVVTSKLSRIMNGSERWTRDALRGQIPVLREIVSKPHLAESFLLFWMSPPDRESRLDWSDDRAWANYAENMAVVSWLAKEGGMKGLMLDPEEYASALQYVHTPADPPFPEAAKLARQRGREVFSRVFKEYPDVVLFTLWYFGRFRHWMETGRQSYPSIRADDGHAFRVRARDFDLDGRIAMFDLVRQADAGAFEGETVVDVPPHAARFFLFDADRRLDRVIYEAETAYLTDYSELYADGLGSPEGRRAQGLVYYAFAHGASGGMAVVNLGGRDTNDLVWKDVNCSAPGPRRLVFWCASPENRSMMLQIDGGAPVEVKVGDTGGKFAPFARDVDFTAGLHAVRLSNPWAKMPDIDRMTVE